MTLEYDEQWNFSKAIFQKHTLTPVTTVFPSGLDIHSYSRKYSNSDGKDEAHWKGHHPDLKG